MSFFYKITLLLILSSPLFGQSPYNWIIPNKPYLKFYVNTDGIYRINKIDFINAGINVNFDPRTVKVYYKGIQQPIFFQGEEDGSFDDTDFFDFYGTRNYGGLTNTYKDSNGVMVVDYVTNEYYNFYSDTNVYWVGWDGNFGLRFPRPNYISQINYPQNSFLNTMHFEQDLYYSLGETYNPTLDFRYFNNEKVTGEGWFWKSMFNGTIVSQNFIPTNLSSNPQQCSFRIWAFPNSSDTNQNEHKIVLKVNGTAINTISRTHYAKFDTIVNFSSSLLNANTTNTISAIYTPNFINPNLTPNVNFDLMEIQYPRTFTFQNNEISFNIDGTDTTSKIYKIKGVVSSNPLSIYDTKNNLQITTGYSINYDTLSFTGKGNGNFQVINKYITKKPFRIEQRQVPNLVASSNGADYIVIYNQLFESQAEQLRSHREQFDNFRAVKTDVNDIIDIFNYGIVDPIAIRNFVSYAFTNWQQPAVGYVCLLGRGSLDPKNNLLSQNYYQNLVPVYGNPQTDGYFVNNNYGTFTYYQKISIGRIPAYTQSEAQDIVNKIIQYDITPHSTWLKRYIMITGGSARDEQQQFQSQANQFINSYINPPPLTMDAHKIYRNDSAGYITYNYSDSIKNEINRGGLIVNFIGHAASQNWELGLADPNTLSNGQMDPLVWSMTCFTGQNSIANSRSFGEEFLYLPNKGAIGFVGTSGWSFAGPGNTLNGYMLEALTLDSMRRIGDLLRYGTLKLSIDSNSFPTRNTINCYNLLGDPATKILLPKLPDFDIEQADYWISDPYPAVKEQVVLKIYPKNLGTYADSCKVRFQILKNSINYTYSDTILRHFAFLDTANYSFKLDTIGNYSLKIILDVDDWYPLENKSNNILIIPLPLRNISFLPIKPFDNSIVRDDSVQIVGLNPGVNPKSNNIKIIIQVDTSKSFTNPIYTAFNTNISGVVSRFNFHPPLLDSNIVYMWRANVIINNDTTGWGSVQRFIFNSAVPNKRTVSHNPVVSNIPTVPNNRSTRNSFGAKNYPKSMNVMLYDSTVTLYYRLPNQFNIGDLANVHYTGTGFELVNSTGNLSSHSYGSNSSEASYLIINGTQIYADGGQNAGLTIAKARKLTCSYIDSKNFRMSTPQSSDSVLNYLNTFDTTEYLLLMKATYVSISDSLRQTAKDKLKQFGSIYVDSISRFDGFDTWAFIGFLGAPQNMVSEDYHFPNPACPNGFCPSDAHLSPMFLNPSGSINFSIGPANKWKNFLWDEILYPNTTIKYDVYTLNQALDTTLIYNNLTNNNLISLDTINSYTYPYLILKAKLSIDSILGTRSPTFRMMNFKFTPPAEIVPDNYSFVKSDSVVQEGKPVTFSLRLYNVGYVPANVIMNTWYANTSNGVQILKIDTVSTPLFVDSSRICSVTFSTLGLRNRQKRVDTVTVFYGATILGGVNDYYPFNNFADAKLVITGDSLPPSIDVTYDGQKILDGDVIAARPYIIYKFLQNNYLSYSLSDTSNVFIKVDNIPVYYNLNGQPNPQISFNPINSQNVKVQVNFQPNLSEGLHVIQYIGKDKNGNSADTLVNNVNVSFGFTIKNLYNIPNPTRGETYFTFMLLSEKSPPVCKIKIYTVAGRLIKEIDSHANVGFNSIYWDGRDGDGDNIANGIYLYKLIIQDGDKNTTAIQKLAKLK